MYRYASDNQDEIPYLKYMENCFCPVFAAVVVAVVFYVYFLRQSFAIFSQINQQMLALSPLGIE